MRPLCLFFVLRLAAGLPLLAADGSVIASIVAPASATHPRNSEGDVIVLKDGTLLAAWTDFYGSAPGDFAPARISGARSADQGATWGQPFTIVANTGVMNVMSASFLRLARGGEILLFYCVKNARTDLKVYVRRSADETKTWSEPLLVTPGPGYHVMNNARVVQLRDGRIICPVARTEEALRPGETYRGVMYFSDDEGRSWSHGQGETACGQRGAMEPGVIELRDGRLLQIIRTQFGMIWHACSSDRGDTWTDARPWTVVAPEAPSTLACFPDSGDFLLVYNPVAQREGASHSGRRTPLAAAISHDEGATWDRMKLIENDLTRTYAYCSVRMLGDRVLLLYHSSANNVSSLEFKSLPFSWFRE